MAYGGKKQGVITGSISWNNKEYVEIFDQNFKYLYGEVDDLFVAYGTWVEYDVVDAPNPHPVNCYKQAIKINMDVKVSKAPTTDDFSRNHMNVRVFNKVDYFQFDSQGDGNLTYKTAIRRNFNNDTYYNKYYGEVILARDSRNRLMEHDINELDVMMTFIPSSRYKGVGPHWEVTHFIHQGKMYSINGYLSIRGFVLRGPGGVVRNRRDVYIPPDALRPLKGAHPPVPSSTSWDEPDAKGGKKNSSGPFGESQKPLNLPTTPRGLSSFGAAFGKTEADSKISAFDTPLKPTGLGDNNLPETPTKPVKSGWNKLPESPKKSVESGWDKLPKSPKKPVESRGKKLVGLGTGEEFGKNKLPETPKKPVESKEIRPIGFGSSGGLGFGSNGGHGFGSGGGYGGRDDFPGFNMSSFNRPIQPASELPPVQKKMDDDDDWGKSRRAPPTRSHRLKLPPQAKTGLSKYSNYQFFQ